MTSTSLTPDFTIGQPLIILDSVDSTNNYAMGQVNEGVVKEGTVYFARLQRMGKGQRGKNWVSATGLNITLSIVLQPFMLNPGDQFMLSAAVALGASDFLMRYADPTECSIKWSNDIYWRDRKAGGILIENVIRGHVWNYAVVGIGLNINQVRFPSSLPNPVSLKLITGKSWDPIQLAAELCKTVEQRYRELVEGQSVRILNQYTRRLLRLNTLSGFKTKGEKLEGIIRCVKGDGKLLLETGGSIREFDFGELEFLF